MTRCKKIKEKRYTIHWLQNGFCYRTTLDCPWSEVLRAKKVARQLGEEIRYEYEKTITWEYTY